jgi:hypothetical protein
VVKEAPKPSKSTQDALNSLLKGNSKEGEKKGEGDDVKEGVKGVFGHISFVFSVFAIYDLIFNTTATSSKERTFTYYSSVLSLTLRGLSTKVGCKSVALVLGKIFTVSQLQALFGTHTVFAINPSHPRHLASMCALVLTLPAILQLTYKVTQSSNVKRSKIVCNLAASSVFLSRVVLHTVNAIVKSNINSL